MSALDCIERISRTSLLNAKLRFCLMSEDKLPKMIDGSMAYPNVDSCFVPLSELLSCTSLEGYAGVAVSVGASKLSAVDIDHCLSVKNDISSISDLAKDIVDMFKAWAYVEISFSGTGIRILFRQPVIDDYKRNYYIKNSNIGVEFYQWNLPARYVSVTGNVIYDNDIEMHENHLDVIQAFIDKYMKRAIPLNDSNNVDETDPRSIEELMKIVRKNYLNDSTFQDAWFMKAPGSGSNESERDYQLLSLIYERVTKDPNKMMEIFVRSKFYQTKDAKHINKWKNQDHRYFKYLYEQIRRTH